MDRKKLNEVELADVIMQLTGEIKPIGETNEDKRRLHNLQLLTKTIDCLIDEIMQVSEDRRRVEYSIQQIGDYATKWFACMIVAIKDCMEWDKE